jgi:hypothetical protein
MKQNQLIEMSPLPVEVVFHPSWWNKHTGITFDEDFFYHPFKRVESEKRMEKELYDRFGEFGIGENHDKKLPIIGAVHNAAGYLLSEMLGCAVRYEAAQAPQVICAAREDFAVDVENVMRSKPAKQLSGLIDKLKAKYGYVCGDVKILREKLPDTFFSIRLDPVTINRTSDHDLEMIIRKLVADSGNPMLTGVCCINMDDKTDDSKIRTIYKTMGELREIEN